MSKSLNNFVNISEFLKRYPKEYLRFWVLKNLWRSPANYQDSTMIEINSSMEKIEEFIRKVQDQQKKKSAKDKGSANLIKKARQDFFSSINDDFNTPKAFSVIFDLIREVNNLIDKDSLSKKESKEIINFFEEINKIFGIIDFSRTKKSKVPNEVEKLLEERENYRKNSEWQKSDELRKEIEKYGYTVDDTKEGPVLKKL